MKITIVFEKETVKKQTMLFPTLVIEQDGNTTHFVFAFWHTMYGVSFVR